MRILHIRRRFLHSATRSGHLTLDPRPSLRRVVLLGASNATVCFPLLVESLRATLGPIELFAAHGHGRSYGMSSKVLWRVLPGIRNCGIWTAMEETPSQGERPLALITDIGNDLLYGAIPDQILRWVELCINRLEEQGAETVITALPMESVAKLGRFRYGFLKSILFPGKGPTWQVMHELAQALNTGVRDLAARRDVPIIRPPGAWYGFDPIHIHWRRRPDAVRTFLSAWETVGREVEVRRPTWGEAVQRWRWRTAESIRFGKTCHVPQPAATMEDGSLVFLY